MLGRYQAWGRVPGWGGLGASTEVRISSPDLQQGLKQGTMTECQKGLQAVCCSVHLCTCLLSHWDKKPSSPCAGAEEAGMQAPPPGKMKGKG